MTHQDHNTPRLMTRIVVAAMVILMALPAFAGPPTDFVEVKRKTLEEVVNQPVSPKRTENLRKIARELIDYDQLAKRSLGAEWDKLNETGQKRFVALLEKVVELNYANRFKEKASTKKYVIKITGEATRGDNSIVKTEISYNDETFTINYKMMAKDGTFIIHDVAFDDVSLQETYRKAYVPIIQKEGWASMFGRISAKCKDLGGTAAECKADTNGIMK